MMFYKFYITILLSVLVFYGCNQGLAPPPLQTSTNSYITGLITYVGGANKWPSKDSVIAIRVVAFQDYPPKDIITELTEGKAFVTGLQSLPLFVDTSSFSIEIPTTPVLIKYIAVAQQYTDSLTAERAVGVYTLSGDNTKPDSLTIQTGKSYFVKIKVNFDSLPPQPF